MATRCLVKICSVYRTSSFHDLLADLSVIVKGMIQSSTLQRLEGSKYSGCTLISEFDLLMIKSYPVFSASVLLPVSRLL